VASLIIGRWDEAVTGRVPDALRKQLGIAIANHTYKAYRQFFSSPRWKRAYNAGARPQRLLWDGKVTRDPKALDAFQIKSLVVPLTVRLISETTLKAFSENGKIDDLMSADGGDCEVVLARFAQAGVDVDALAAQLQSQEADLHVKSWIELMAVIASKSAALTTNHYIEREKEAKA
jgi:transaldolase